MVIPLTEVVAEIDGQVVYRAELPPGSYAIGREPGIAIFIDSEHISRRHADLTLSYYDWTIEDCGSSNGTRVAGERITEATAVFPTQEVQVGNAILRLRRVRSDDPNQSLAPQTAAVDFYLPENLRTEQKYRIRGVIGYGGMGVVLEAEDVATRRVVAMKMMKNMSSVEDITRFIEEAQVTAQLEHPNIIPIYELNVNEMDKPFYTMRLVKGFSLKDVLQKLLLENKTTIEHYRLPELLTILGKVCDAIAFAHAKGVVHRDLKPENIQLGEFGEVMVMDWGLCKPLGHHASAIDFTSTMRTMVVSARREDEGALRTMEGSILGSPQYMSPEQASGKSHEVDARSDIYSLGAMLYSILTLQPPVDGRDVHEVIERVTGGVIVAPEAATRGRNLPHLPEGQIPAELSRVAMKALSLRPEDRFASVKEFQTAIRQGHSDDKRGGLFGFLGKAKK